MELRYLLAVVTGAGSGLGHEIAVALSRVGAAVLVADRDLAAAEATAEVVRAARVSAWALQVDLSEPAEVRLLAERARDLGGADLLVNNAGGWTPGEQQYPEVAAEVWGRTLDLNLRAPMLLTQEVLVAAAQRPRRRAGSPAVVNVASSAATPAPDESGYGSPEYAAAKAGLVRLTTALGDHPVGRVMAVVPGWIGLPRAVEQWAALDEAERAGRTPPMPPATVTRTVVDLLAHGEPGAVVVLDGEGAHPAPPRVTAP